MKSKFLRKKLLFLLMAIMVMALSVTACGSSDDDDDKASKSKNEESEDDDDEDDDKKDKDDDKDEDDEDEPKVTPEPTPEATPEPTPEPTVEPAEDNWETAYEDYFDNCGSLINENVLIYAYGESDGSYVDVGYAYNDTMRMMMFTIDDSYMEALGTANGLYAECETADDYYFAYTPMEMDSIEDFDELFVAVDFFEFTDNIEYESYLGEIEDSGIMYDAVACSVLDSGEWYDAECYINRDTQLVEELDVYFEDSESLIVSFEYYEEAALNVEVEAIEEGFLSEGSEVSLDEMEIIFLSFFESAAVQGLDEEDVEPSEPVVTDSSEDDEWATAYDGYFDNGITLPDSFEISTYMDIEGLQLDYVVTVEDGITKVSYLLGGYGVDAYTDGEMLYIGSETVSDFEWVYAVLESPEQMANVIGADFTAIVTGSTDEVESHTYMGSVTENGVVYDVMEVYVPGDADPATVYVNRETQEIDKMIMESEGLEMTCLFEGFEMMDIPAEMYDATEVTVDELTTIYQESMITCAMKAMGM